jgi:hypothetical protein
MFLNNVTGFMGSITCVPIHMHLTLHYLKLVLWKVPKVVTTVQVVVRRAASPMPYHITNTNFWLELDWSVASTFLCIIIKYIELILCITLVLKSHWCVLQNQNLELLHKNMEKDKYEVRSTIRINRFLLFTLIKKLNRTEDSRRVNEIAINIGISSPSNSIWRCRRSELS